MVLSHRFSEDTLLDLQQPFTTADGCASFPTVALTIAGGDLLFRHKKNWCLTLNREDQEKHKSLQ
jgi:hypothetical protein